MKTPFGIALQLAAKEFFGSNKRYAIALGCTEGFISQCKSSTQLQPDTVAQLVAPFDLTTQEHLYEEWRRTLAPSPLESRTPGPDASDDEILRFATDARVLLEHGSAAMIAKLLKKTWRGLGAQRRPYIAAEVGWALVEALYLLDRRTEGINIAAQMRDLARANDEPEQLLRACWLEALGTRSLVPGEPERADAAFAITTEQADTWRPLGQTGKAFKAVLVETLVRDMVLLSWDKARFGVSGGKEALSDNVGRLEEIGRTLGRSGINDEVLARALVELGETDGAESYITDAEHRHINKLQQAKIAITRVRLELKRGNAQDAYSHWLRAVRLCENVGFTHYRMELALLQRDILKCEESQRRERT